MTNSFADTSYAAHRQEYAVHVVDGAVSEHAKSWLRTDTIGYEIATRVRSTVLPLLAAYPDASWLTVGDGGFGNDAHFLHAHGAGDVLATDISPDLLEEAVRTGYIPASACENAERLSFADGAFDFVHCKEAYHHFPRPYLALYEMLRVARRGVVLIEPTDRWIGGALARAIFTGIRRCLGKRTEKHSFETVGNYLYALSVREMEKVALGLNLPVVAHRTVNFVYRYGVEFAPARWSSPLYWRMRAMLAIKDALTALRLVPPSLTVVVLFAETPTPDQCQVLTAGGFTVERLPPNPYLSSGH